MKILGINPKDFYTGWPVQSDFGRELYRCPSLTFPVLDALLDDGHETRFFDGFFDDRPFKTYMELIKWADVVGMNIASNYGALNYAILIRQIKRLNPGAFIMAGGHHANMFPQRWLDMGVNLIATGESELMYADLIREIEGKRRFDKVPGVAWKEDGEFVRTPSPPQLEFLDESPYPNWDMVNFEAHPCRVSGKKGYVGAIETSRGCQFRCKFCATPVYWKGTQRYKSISRVLREAENLLERKVSQINVVDDGFGNDVEYAIELADAFRRMDRDFIWNAFLRVDTVLKRPDLIDKLGRSGFTATLLGFESLNEEVLARTMGKGMRVKPTIRDLQELYKRFRKNNILVVGVFISGHPDIKKEQESSYLEARTVCDDPRLADYMPTPGTIGFDELASRHEMKDMFFHDVKLPVFDRQSPEAFRFNVMNILDVPRSIRMLAGSPMHRMYFLRSHKRLWTKLFRVNRRKLQDLALLKNCAKTADQRQEELFQRYLNPEFDAWLDSQADRVWC